ncbi:MAG: ABC transporter permease [Candidatus Kryptoniota bacterium]
MMKTRENKLTPLLKKELLIYMKSPSNYVVMVIFLLIAGYIFADGLFVANIASLRSFFTLSAVLFIFFVPAITMRSFSEEFRNGTIEVIATHPVSRWNMIVSKFFSTYLLVLATLLPTLIYYVIVASLGKIDPGTVIAGYFGIVLLAGGYIAAGIFASSLTQNQVAAFIIGLFILFIFFILDKVTALTSGTLAYVLQYASSDFHLSNFYRGVVDLRDIIYFGSVSIFFLALTEKWLELKFK